MLFAWKGATVFQAGPSLAMNWYDTNGDGTQVGAGNRTGDGDAMCGNAVMYDATAGKILVTGGAVDYVYLPRCLRTPQNPLAHMFRSKTPARPQTPTSSRSTTR